MLGFSPVGGSPTGATGGSVAPPAPPPPGTPHRFWRLFYTSSNSGNISSTDLQLRATVGGPNIAVGGVGSASSSYFGGSTANDVWAGGITFATTGGAPQWNAYDLGPGNASPVVEIAYTVRTDGYSEQSPSAGVLQYSDNGTDWTTDGQTIPFGTWTVGQQKVFDIVPVPPQSISKMAAYVIEGSTVAPQSASKLAAYVIEGGGEKLYSSKLAAYVIEGPPSDTARNMSQAMLGTF